MFSGASSCFPFGVPFPSSEGSLGLPVLSQFTPVCPLTLISPPIPPSFLYVAEFLECSAGHWSESRRDVGQHSYRHVRSCQERVRQGGPGSSVLPLQPPLSPSSAFDPAQGLGWGKGTKGRLSWRIVEGSLWFPAGLSRTSASSLGRSQQGWSRRWNRHYLPQVPRTATCPLELCVPMPGLKWGFDKWKRGGERGS